MGHMAKRKMAERPVSIEKEKLLGQLRLNLKRHKSDYEKAVNAYQEKALEKISSLEEDVFEKVRENFEKAKSKLKGFDKDNPHLLQLNTAIVEPQFLDLPVPVNYSEAYENAITLFEWEQQEVVELSAAEFTCFVKNKWEWTNDFEVSTMSYLD